MLADYSAHILALSLATADNSPEFTDPNNPRPVISTKTDTNPNITFNVMIVSLDVDLGKGNAGGS
ncbi:hypothetical protein ACFL6S_23920 [Candidatus Poribacteria bacterium]